MNLENKKGVSLVFTLYVVLVLIVLGSAFILRAVHESAMAQKERDLAKSFYIAEAGTNVGLDSLDILINTDLLNTVNSTNPQKVSNDAEDYVADEDSLGFLVEYVQKDGQEQFVLNQTGTEAQYITQAVSLGGGSFQFNIIVTQKGDPLTVSSDVWDFPYYYRVESTGSSQNIGRQILLSGDFTIRIQRDNFAKYALFTDHHTMKSGTTVWFTNKTNFAGPVHTNERFSFALNPSGTFDGAVTQHITTARFYNQGNSILADADSNPPYDVPTFNAGFEREEDEIVLESAVQKQDLEDQATGGENIVGDGIFIPNDGNNLTGGIFVRGDSTINMGVDGSGNATYTISEGGTTKTVTVDLVNNQTTVSRTGFPDETYIGSPDGVDDVGTIVYVDGEVSSLSGTVQKDTEVTISSENDIIIQNHVRYENYTPAVGTPGSPSYVPPNADGEKNLLGVLSWGGDVRIGALAPDNIDIHGIVMARNGVYTVDGYGDQGRGPRGTNTLLGGVITQFYGAFGLFDGGSGNQLAGYGRNFCYDERTLTGGSAPPYFPSLNTFIAFTNDITDKTVWQEGGL